METLPAPVKNAIVEKGRELGCCAIGFAAIRQQITAMGRLREMIADRRHGELGYLETGMEKRENPNLLLAGVKTVVSVAIAGPMPVPRQGRRPGLAAYATVPDYHIVMRRVLNELLDFIRNNSPRPIAGLACVDGAPVLEKSWAETAGTGRTGKNTLVIIPGAGSRIFLGELLLNAAITPDDPTEDADPCGNCTACIDACPTGALVAPGKLDATRCIAYLTIELRREFTPGEAAMAGHSLFGCDRCMDACPHNADGGYPPHSAFTPHSDLADFSAEEAVALTGSSFRKRFAGTAVMRLGLKRLKRNARAVLEHRNPGG